VNIEIMGHKLSERIMQVSGFTWDEARDAFSQKVQDPVLEFSRGYMSMGRQEDRGHNIDNQGYYMERRLTRLGRIYSSTTE
jgi:hypothetical protein